MNPLLSAYSHISSIAACMEACSSGDEPGLAMVKRIIDINMGCTLVLTPRQKHGGPAPEPAARTSIERGPHLTDTEVAEALWLPWQPRGRVVRLTARRTWRGSQQCIVARAH